MTKYAYEYGKRWNVKTPRGDIDWLVGTLHVGQSESEVIGEIEQRIPEGKAGYTPAIRRECVRYALLAHQRNREVYRKVMVG